MHYDIIIIGSGIGGGTLSWALRNSGARILMIERGGFLPQEKENWDAEAVFGAGRYKARELWEDGDGASFAPGVHYAVGGNSKVFGAALPRFRKHDFGAVEHEGGTSPAWPITYEDLEPWYVRAERLYRAHGRAGCDPTEPQRSAPYPHPEVPHEPEVEALALAFRQQGLHPFHLPMGIDLGPGGRCIRCHTCDGYPCKVLAKCDAELCCVRPALESPSVEIMTRTFARRLIASGRHVEAVEVEHDGTRSLIRGDTFVVACGAANSAALLFRSREGGLANSSGLVGRNYMMHNNSVLLAISARRRNRTVFQKTLSINDFYFGGPGWPYPMGNLQIIGKVQASMLKTVQPRVPMPVLQAVAHRSMDWWVMSEDLPDERNRVTVTSGGRIRIRWKPNNLAAHGRLVREARKLMRRAGYTLVLTRAMGIATNSHQCGTLRFGADPATSVLDPWCRSHDIRNLYVVDSSFMPSSAAMNPALTIAAQSLRTAEHIRQNT